MLGDVMFTRYYQLTQFIKTVAGLFSYGLAFLMIAVWFVAFQNGNHVLLDINSIGEAIPELVMWVALIPLFIYGAFQTFKELFRMRRWMRKKWGYPAWINRIDRLQRWI